MDSPWVQIIVLGIVQGITEFLPISSSGHLAVGQRLFGIREGNLLISIALHAGSLVAIAAYYYRDLLDLFRRRDWPLVGRLILATLPLVILGYPLKKLLDRFGSNLWVTAAGFGVTAVLLLTVHGRKAHAVPAELSWWHIAWIGLAQCVAVAPGVSRSGSTISVGTRCGLNPEAAARFSFLMGIPAILGAVALEVKDLLEGAPPPVPWAALATGLLLSLAVGYGSLAVLIRVLQRGRWRGFGYYCGAAALVTLIIQLTN